MIPMVRTFGAPVIDPLGKSARKTSGTPAPGLEVGRHRGRQLPHGLEALRLEHLGPSNRARTRDAAEVVAQQVDDHRVLGTVLHRGRETFPRGVVLREPAAARRGALHRARGQPVAVQPEEQLRRGRQDAVSPGVQVRGVCAPLRVAEVAVEAPLVAFDGRAQPQRVVHLIRVARGDVLADPRDGQVVAGRGRSSAPTRRTAVSRRAAREARSPAAAGTSRTRRAAAGRTDRPADADARRATGPARATPRTSRTRRPTARARPRPRRPPAWAARPPAAPPRGRPRGP